MIPFSILDLAPIAEGSDASQSFKNTLDLAQHGERWGYHRYWLAEHHGMPGIASAATAVVIAHVAAGTTTIRVGAGGVMLPNHSPLIIAEQFPQDVLELIDYMSDEPRQRVLAVPGKGAKVPVWILGSSLFGAQLAAHLGLPYAFASHFAPQMMLQAVAYYREHFKPSQQLAKPYVMLGFNVFAADTDAEAHLRATSMQQAFVNLRTGRPSRLQPPVPGYLEQLGPQERAMLDSVLSCTAIGAPDTVKAKMASFIAETGADELMITSQIFEHQHRLRSYEITAQVHAELAQQQ